MPIDAKRDRILNGLRKKRGRSHRYTNWRWGVAVVSTLAIASLPLTGTLRFDLWGGRHLFLGEEVDLVTAAKAFAFPFLAVNVLIILASRFLGRYLCGFACPVGALARLGEWSRSMAEGRGKRVKGALLLLIASALLATITILFWVDPRVFLEGSPAAVGFWGGSFLVLTLATFFITYRLGLGFCRDLCPSGVYFAVLGPRTMNGIEFANPEACTECKACEVVCPVDLKPTKMRSAETRAGSGLYPDALSNFALCLRCGDCVNACEGMTDRFDTSTPLRMGWLGPGGDRWEEDSPPS